MNVSLTPELEQYINDKVATGRYASASEVVREALRAQEARERKFAALKADIDAAIKEVEEGKAIEMTPEAWEDLKQRARAAYDSAQQEKLKKAS